MTAGPTKISDLVNPEVLAPIVSYDLDKALRFTPLAQIDDTLVGNPGDTLTFSKYTYIGDAADVGEGEDIPLDKLGTSKVTAKVKKAAKGVSITDEALLSGAGDPLGENVHQLSLSLANKIDSDLMTAALAGSVTVADVTADIDGLQMMLDKFNDDGDYPYVAVMSPKTAAKIRRDAIDKKSGSEAGANSLVTGTYYDVLGVQIVRTKKMADDKIVMFKIVPKSPALKLVRKRTVQTESDRNIINKTTIITSDCHYVAYVYDDSKLVVGTLKGE